MKHYQHNPYACRVIDLNRSSRTPSPGPEHDAMYLDEGTLHTGLAGSVNFVPYPKTVAANPYVPAKCELVRLFVGQLPYDTTAVQAEWIIRACTGVQTYYTEQIHSWKGASHQPKGCVHTFVHPDEARRVIYLLHHAVLVDDTGVWFAEDEEQFRALEAYCIAMKLDKTRRFKNRPYQLLVVEIADSTFVRREGRAMDAASEEEARFYSGQAAGAGATTTMLPPPPSYEETLNAC